LITALGVRSSGPPARASAGGAFVRAAGPGDIDKTFGPNVVYSSAPAGMKQNLPPTAGMQYYGVCKIDGLSGIMTHALYDVAGKELYKVALNPEV
jgi:alkaline phosphatase D